jgi:hypothetical protein
VLVAGTAHAWTNIINVVNSPTAQKTINVSTSTNAMLPDAAVQNITNAPNFFFSQRFPLEQDLSATDTVFTATQGTYSTNGCYLLIGKEVMQVTNLVYSGGTTQQLTVIRFRDWGDLSAQTHTNDIPIYTLSDILVRNVYEVNGDKEESIWKKTERLTNELQAKLGKSVNVVYLPVLFCQSNADTNKYVAATANLVNGVLDSPNYYMTDPGNDNFRLSATTALNQLSIQAQYPSGNEAWNNYHVQQGELHCGSNAKRTIPGVTQWWTNSIYANWPNE